MEQWTSYQIMIGSLFSWDILIIGLAHNMSWKITIFIYNDYVKFIYITIGANLNKVCNKKLCLLVQILTKESNQVKFSWITTDVPNLPLISKWNFNGKLQWNFMHTTIWNSSAGIPDLYLKLMCNSDIPTFCDIHPSTDSLFQKYYYLFSLTIIRGSCQSSVQWPNIDKELT